MLRLWSSGAPRVGPSVACPFCPIPGTKGSCFPHVQSLCVVWKSHCSLGHFFRNPDEFKTFPSAEEVKVSALLTLDHQQYLNALP